jgi:hypothetical protein
MSLTRRDEINGILFAQARTRLVTLERLHRQYPALLSHCEYKIRQADYVSDYFYPSALNNRAIVSSVEITKKLCEKLSCNFAGPKGQCTSNDVAYNYRLGDRPEFQTACEPACFNLLNNPTYHEDGTELPQMLRVQYNNGRCAIVPSGATWAEIPLYRSSEIYETRVNDLPVGFNLRHNPFTNSGLSYNYNESYCTAFFDQWDAQNEICYTRWYERIFNAVIGEAIIKLTRAGITALQNNGNTVPQLPNLPDIPPIDQKYHVENWITDINKSFAPPDPNGDNDKIVNDLTPNTSPKRRIEPPNINDDREIPPIVTDFDDGFFDDLMGKILQIIGDILTDPDFYFTIGADIGLELILRGIRKTAKSAINKATSAVAALIARVAATPIPSRIFGAAIRIALTKMVAQVAIKVTAQFLVAIARILVLATSVIGIILVIISIFDILLTFWDPLGFNNKYPPGFLDDVMWNSDLALRQDFQMSSPEITFDMLNFLLSTEEEIIQDNLIAFEWIFEYFMALEVNSEGRRIDRGPLIVLDPSTNLLHPYDAAAARMTVPTRADFIEFEARHQARWELSKHAHQYAWAVSALALAFVFLGTHLFATILFFIALILFAISIINLDVDVILDNVPRPKI